jgi:NADPH:quinone reductase-like Zn-dependent oxidoreductase
VAIAIMGISNAPFDAGERARQRSRPCYAQREVMLNALMKAYGFTRYGGPETEAFLDLPVPEPGPGELLVRVTAAGVNPADWKVRSGLRRAELPLEPPVALGREVAGVVEQVGSGVSGFAAGDDVFGGTVGSVGGWAEFARVPAAFAAHRPSEVAVTDAATLPVAAATAYDALVQLALTPGATLLVIGAGGGVGLAAVQLARARGVEVVGIASPGKHQLLTGLGATPIAPDADVPGAVDAVIDLVGGDALRGAVAGLRTPAIVSAADRPTVVELGGGPVERVRSGERLAEVARLVAEGTLDPHVTEVRPFTEAASALALVEGGHARGKIVLRIR